MARCSRCGTVYQDGAPYCPNCGAQEPVYDQPYPPQGPAYTQPPVQPPQGPAYAQPPVQQPQEPPYTSPMQQQEPMYTQPPVYAPPPVNPYPPMPTNPYYVQPVQLPSYNGMSIAGFVLSCVSLVLCCFPITAIIGLILSIIGVPQTESRGERGKGLAVAGIVLNGLVLLFWIIMLILPLMGVYIENDLFY